MKIPRLPSWVRNWLVEQKDSELISTLTWNVGFVGILDGSRLILLYSNHLEADRLYRTISFTQVQVCINVHT